MNEILLAPEWEWQDAILLVWPHSKSDWSQNLSCIENTYCELASCICLTQQLIIVAQNPNHAQYIYEITSKLSIDTNNLLITSIPSNDTWVRDYGPLCINTDNGNTYLNFEFDAWGGKYEYQIDNAFNSILYKKLNLSAVYEQIDFILEGGNIEVNSKGELLSSLSCFSRNDNLNLEDIEHNLQQWLGIQEFYWINCGKLAGDDTDGHIDTLARFCTDNIIVYSAENYFNDQNSQTLQTLYCQLENINQQSPQKFELVPLPLPEPVYKNKQQLPATYTNFIITNHNVIVPTFDDKQDSYVLRTMQDLFPDREVIGINSLAMIQQFGGLHCATMHLPANILQNSE